MYLMGFGAGTLTPWVSVLNQTPQLMLVADKAHGFLRNEHQGIPQRINIQITSPLNQKQVS